MILENFHTATADPGVRCVACTLLFNRVFGMKRDAKTARKLIGKIEASHRRRVRRFGHAPFFAWGLEHDRDSGLHVHIIATVPMRDGPAARDGIRAVIGRVMPGGLLFNGPFGLIWDTAEKQVAANWLMYLLKTAVAPGDVIQGIAGAVLDAPKPTGRTFGASRARPVSAPVLTRTARPPKARVRTYSARWTKEEAEARRDLRRRLYRERAERRAIIYSPSCTPGPWTHSGFIAAITERFTMPTFAKSKKRHRLRGLQVAEISLCSNGMNQGARLLIAKSADGQSVELEIAEVNAERQYVAGWASIIERDGEPVEDHEGDLLDLDTLRAAASDFMASSRRGAVRHGKDTAVVWAESLVVDHDLQEAWGIDLGFVGWWVGGTITDAEIWKRVKSRELRSLSIGGSSARDPVEDEAEVRKSAPDTRARTVDQILALRGERDIARQLTLRPKPKPMAPKPDAEAAVHLSRGLLAMDQAERGQRAAREAIAQRHGHAGPKQNARTVATQPASVARPRDAVGMARTALMERAASRSVKKSDDTPAAAPRSAVELTRAVLASRRGN